MKELEGPEPLSRPGAVVARLQRAGAGAGRGPQASAAGTGQVPGHLLPQPRRVLHDPGGGPARPGRRRSRGGRHRRPRPPRRAELHPQADGGTRPPPDRRLPRRGAAAAGRGGDPAARLALPREEAPEGARTVLRGPDLPRPHAAVRRPGAPVPLHLQPVAQPGDHGPRPGAGRAPLRPGQGAAAAAPVREDDRRHVLRAARAGHRRPPRPALPRDGDRAALPVPGDAQRRPQRGRRGVRRPAGHHRDGAAPAPLRPRHPRSRSIPACRGRSATC